MAKIHNVTALMAFVFIVLLLGTLMHPVDFLSKDIETIYHENEGLIWMIGILVGVALAVLTYINGVYQSELKHCANQNLEKNTVIQEQNIEIIKNQKEYIIEMHRLSAQINNNFSQDNELIKKVNELTLMVTELSKRMDKFEKRNGG